MSVRLLEGGVAAGFAAGDALIAAKVTRMGPGGIPFSVLYEAGGILAGVFGGKIGLSGEVKDTLLISSIALASARVTKAGISGKLMLGPKAWGGEGDGYANIGAGGGEGGDYDAGGVPGGRSRVRMLPGGRGGGFSVWPVSQEAPGVAG